MAQHDYVIDNSTGANVRSDINSVLQAIVTNNSGSSEPTTTYAFQLFADTTNNVMKIRNAANNTFIELFQLDGTFTLEDGSAASPGLALRDDLNTGLFSAENDTISISTAGNERFRFGSAGQIGIGGSTYGSSGQVLTSQGASAAPIWSSSSGTTINNNADNRVITGSGTANTLEAESTITYDASLLNITSTTSGLGLRLTNTGNGYTNIQFDAARTSAGAALGIMNAKWNNNHEVAAIYLQAGDDTTNKDDGQIKFYTAAASGSIAERFHIKNNGDVSVSDGNLVIGTSGHGIDFSAASGSNAGASSSILDDYEEGTFTPQFAGVGGGPTSISFNFNGGNYVKIGELVFVSGRSEITASSGGSQHWLITNMPFNLKANDKKFSTVGHIALENFSIPDDVIDLVGVMDSGNNNMLFSGTRKDNTLSVGISHGNDQVYNVQFAVCYRAN